MAAPHVVHLVQEYYPKDVRVRKEAEVLVRNGYRVTVICLNNGMFPSRENVGGVEVFRVNMKKERAGKLQYVYEYAAFFLRAFVRMNLINLRNKIDAVHVSTLPDCLVFAAIVQKLKGAQIVLDMHEVMPEFFMSKFGVAATHPVVRLLRLQEKMSLKFADKIITINEPIKRLFQERSVPDKPIEVVMNTVDAATCPAAPTVAHDGFNCVYHGTLTQWYGLDVAVKGFAHALQYADGLHFHVFGEGPYREGMGELCRNLGIDGNVTFHGQVDHALMYKQLGEMDLGILPMPKDIFTNLSFSNKLSEYIYMKIPVVHSDLDSIQSCFTDTEIMYFASGDVSGLGNKIIYARNHPVEIRAMAEKAFDAYRPIDWSVMAERYLRVIASD